MYVILVWTINLTTKKIIQTNNLYKFDYLSITSYITKSKICLLSYLLIGLISFYAPDWFTIIILLIPAILVFLTWISRSTSSSQAPEDFPWQHVGLPRFGILLSPINSKKSFLVWLIILVVLPLVFREWCLISAIGSSTHYTNQQDISRRIAESVLWAYLVEETFYRWLSITIWGTEGLVLGSVVWLVIHPMARLVEDANVLCISTGILMWLFHMLFYIKVWRGKYYIASYMVHSLFNLTILIATTAFHFPT